MGKSAQPVQIPGAPSSDTPQADGNPAADTAAPDARDGAAPDTDLADRLAAAEAENRRLKAVLTAQQAGQGGDMTGAVIEPVTPHGAAHLAASKHKHMTSVELDAKVRSGEVKLTDHHVLCSDGWYVNPTA